MCLASKYPETVALCRGVYLHVCALHLNTLRQLHYAGGILTCMCLASKYPEAVALRRVDAETVAETMMEIFSRTGLPKEILADQGSVFRGTSPNSSVDSSMSNS